MTDRTTKSIEIIDYAIKNKISIKKATSFFGFNETYVKNAKADLIERFEKGRIEQEELNIFLSKYKEYVDSKNQTQLQIKKNNSSIESTNLLNNDNDLSSDDSETEDFEAYCKKNNINSKDIITYWHKSKQYSIYLRNNQERLNQQFEILKDLLKQETKPVSKERKNVLSNNYDNCAVINIFDLHIDKKAYDSSEDGIEGVLRVKNEIKRGFDEILQSTLIHKPNTIIFPIGNDLLNSNGFTTATVKGTPQVNLVEQDAAFRQALELCKYMIDRITQETSAKVLIPIVSGNHCYSDDTEVLTNNGWKKHQDLLSTDLVASFDKEDRKIKFTTFTDYFVDEYVGEMHNFKNKYSDLLVTPNHTLLLRKIMEDDYINIESNKIKNINSMVFRLSSKPLINEEYPIEDEWLQLFAWINSDGTLKAQQNTDLYVIYQREEKSYLIKNILDKLGIKYKFTIRDRSEIKFICGKELKSRAKIQHEFHLNSAHTDKKHLDFIKSYLYNKYIIPEILFKCSKRQVDIYLKSYIQGDGTVRKESPNSGAIYGVKSILDQLQTISILNGNSATLTEYRKNAWRLNLCFNHENGIITMKHKKTINYNGNVWCITVPSGNFITRRNGKPSIQGNSKHSEFYLGVCLEVMYHNNPQIEINNEIKDDRKYYIFEDILFAFMHGDKYLNKIAQLPMIVMQENRNRLSETKFTQCYLGDQHHKMEFKFFRTKDYPGCNVSFLRGTSVTDGWHQDMGYVGVPRTIEAFIWKKGKGQIANYSINL